jgi:hypothetical protein
MDARALYVSVVSELIPPHFFDDLAKWREGRTPGSLECDLLQQFRYRSTSLLTGYSTQILRQFLAGGVGTSPASPPLGGVDNRLEFSHPEG